MVSVVDKAPLAPRTAERIVARRQAIAERVREINAQLDPAYEAAIEYARNHRLDGFWWTMRDQIMKLEAAKRKLIAEDKRIEQKLKRINAKAQ